MNFARHLAFCAGAGICVMAGASILAELGILLYSLMGTWFFLALLFVICVVLAAISTYDPNRSRE